MTKKPKISKNISKHLFLSNLDKKPLTPYSKKINYLDILEYKLKFIRNKEITKESKEDKNYMKNRIKSLF